MKLKALLLALAVAGLAASFGLTATGRSDTGTSTGTTTGTTTTATESTTTTTTSTGDCTRFWLAGTIASVSASSFTVDPVQARHSKTTATGPVTVAVSPRTQVLWWGRGTLAGPSVGDLVRVHGKQCGDTLTASLVQASPAKHDAGPQRGDKQGGDKQGSDAHSPGAEGKSRLHH
jgi:hypothetical protein